MYIHVPGSWVHWENIKKETVRIEGKTAFSKTDLRVTRVPIQVAKNAIGHVLEDYLDGILKEES